MTELSPLGTIASPRESAPAASRGSGRPPIGVDLKLVNSSGMTLSPQRNVVGRLRVKGASVADGYFAEERGELDAEGYFDTGDLGVIDEAGHLTIVGRAKDLIKSGGEWINPREIEDIVGSLPEVALASVIGRFDVKWGERPLLVVEPRRKHAIDEGRVIGALRGKVPDWWLPERIVVLERMPLAATGKRDKKRLREEFGNR
ncbi:MAG: AMP-binding enzyme [Steroidobacteraceae bacterium]